MLDEVHCFKKKNLVTQTTEAVTEEPVSGDLGNKITSVIHQNIYAQIQIP